MLREARRDVVCEVLAGGERGVLSEMCCLKCVCVGRRGRGLELRVVKQGRRSEMHWNEGCYYAAW